MAGRVSKVILSRAARSIVRTRVSSSWMTVSRYSTGGEQEHLAQFPGAKASYTENLEILQPDVTHGIPIYRTWSRRTWRRR